MNSQEVFDFIKNECWLLDDQDTVNNNIYYFVIYEGLQNILQLVVFDGFPVKGYMNLTEDENLFYPAINVDEYSWEIIDPDISFDKIMVPNHELWAKLSQIKNRSFNEMSENAWLREQIAYLFDSQKYEAGYVFTSSQELKNFIDENF